MKRTISLAIVVSALAAGVAASATAAGHRSQTSVTLHVRSQLQHASYVDNAPQGPSAGDDLVFTERLLNSSGRSIGSDAASCIVLFDQRSLCTAAYILPAGQIMAALVQPGLTRHRIYNQAITGGTGSYARATGTVTVDQRASGDRFTFHIHLPAG